MESRQNLGLKGSAGSSSLVFANAAALCAVAAMLLVSWLVSGCRGALEPVVDPAFTKEGGSMKISKDQARAIAEQEAKKMRAGNLDVNAPTLVQQSDWRVVAEPLTPSSSGKLTNFLPAVVSRAVAEEIAREDAKARLGGVN